MKKYSLLANNNCSGLSQVEIMVAIVIIGIVILGIITTFSTIGKGLITGKTRTIANNLAQEKIEVLKNLSYARLLVTPDGYDYFPSEQGYTEYEPETLNVGDANYTRYTTVWKAQESDNKISTMSSTAADQGIKKIKIEVRWMEGTEEKSLVLYNLRDDPNRTTMSGTVYGIVSSTSGVGISDAKVEIVQDINKNDMTSTTGYYIIKTTSPATVCINVSKDGYWSKTSANFAVNTNPQNVQLTAKERGNAYGFVYKRDHLVISEVCQTLVDDATEYVELYNPTTYQITVNGNYKLKYVDNFDAISDFTLSYINSVVDSHRYFLIASYPAVNGVSADATYPSAKMSNTSSKGAIGLWNNFDIWVDSIAWGPTGGSANAREGNGFTIAAGNFSTNDSIERVSYSTYTAAQMIGDQNGNAFDNDKNEEDWVFHDEQVNPQNSGMSEAPVLGTPAGGAIVSANDGLSDTTIASSTGYYYLTGIATGTSVTVYGSSLSLMGFVLNNSIAVGGSTKCDIILSSAAEGGFITGRVVNGSNEQPVANITVSAGGYATTTDSNGYYNLSVEVGSYTVIANPDYSSSPDGASWTSGSSDSAACATTGVDLGEVVTIGSDLKIYHAGWISGTTYNTTGGLLPYITIRATSTAASFSSDAVSEVDGTYIMKGVKTASDYELYPVLDEADTYSKDGGWTTPVIVTAGVESSGKNFKIGSAWGKITGTVSDTAIGGNIKTGVLIIATSDAMPSDSPPKISGGNIEGLGTAIYYGTVSNSSGNYEVLVRKGWTYNLKAWYVKISGDTVVIQPTKTGSVVFGTSDLSKTVSFSWP